MKPQEHHPRGRISGYTAEALEASGIWAALLGSAAAVTAVITGIAGVVRLTNGQPWPQKITASAAAVFICLVSLRLAYAMWVLWQVSAAAKQNGSVTPQQTAAGFGVMAAVLQCGIAYTLILAVQAIVLKVLAAA